MIKRTGITSNRKCKARICMPTWSGFSNETYRGAQYEAQDILHYVDDVDLIHIEATNRFKFSEKIITTFGSKGFYQKKRS